MLINDNGVVRDMTPEEIKRHEEMWADAPLHKQVAAIMEFNDHEAEEFYRSIGEF